MYFDPICGTSGNEWGDLTTFDPIQSRFLTLKTSASIVMSDVVHCKLPTQLVNLEYNWIGFWIDYKKKND
ncbi:MAG TPA: hypothetical protein PK079_21650 [Leptospiraceae bacterium]|nr:hypothetical protein [Leptospiraceae bacterium]HMW08098.1 hypothetical protein [Leptospiraceae bacterium]HMY33809.1 hypothetical protein [Leptospiraceae bacterium]HMZ65920.1 hypothetical protein [Leptospiraceae bacterium]HNA08858.1 hypothetical protein [Leptospiraceae bacterium]